MNSVTLADVLPVMDEQLEKGNEVSFTPFGNSMFPTIRSGRDKVILKRTKTLSKDDICLFITNSEKPVLHRVISTKNGIVTRGDNSVKTDTTPKKIYGKVVAVYKNGKLKDINSLYFNVCKVYVKCIFPLRLFYNKAVAKIKYLIKRKR